VIRKEKWKDTTHNTALLYMFDSNGCQKRY